MVIKIKRGGEGKEKGLKRKEYLRSRSILVSRSFCKLRMSRAILETILCYEGIFKGSVSRA